MSLIIFVDALPYTFIMERQGSSLGQYGVHGIKPYVGYSSNLHWKLFLNKTPDEIGFFTDWVRIQEKNWKIKAISTLLRPIDSIHKFSIFTKKILNHIPSLRSAFGNIPFRYRSSFSNVANYLLANSDNLKKSDAYKTYSMILQDETKTSIDEIVLQAEKYISENKKNIFVSISDVDKLGHFWGRGKNYDYAIEDIMKKIERIVNAYSLKNPLGKVIIVSDHGMLNASSVIEWDDLNLPKSNKIIYSFDSEVMKIYGNSADLKDVAEILSKSKYGHLLTKEERAYYGITDPKFGQLIFNLYEPYTFGNNWFSGRLKKSNKINGMHGYWPNNDVSDHYGVLIENSNSSTLNSIIDYNEASSFIMEHI